ncbi:Six-hairpin glycosidase-like protein [Gaertneriomyces semiglobifer]|nr:Six-hairpin glycosidase-like protein [Gaertneriomyces semiglobifer]
MRGTQFTAVSLLVLCCASLVDVATAQGTTTVPANALTPDGPVVDSAKYEAPKEAKYDYVDVLHKSYLFYWAQRSGALPYKRLAWRGDSCLDCKGAYGEDLSGAWYEAANTMKWGGPLGFTVTQLAWNVYEYADTLKQIGEYGEAVSWVRHGAEYLLNVYTEEGGEGRLVGNFGVSAAMVNGKEEDVDFGYFGPPEEWPAWRPFGVDRQAWYCRAGGAQNQSCSDIAGDYASALAAAAVVMKPVDEGFAKRCLDMAERIFAFGNQHKGSYMDPGFNEFGWKTYREWYPSSGFTDELAWASTWLYIATQSPDYLAIATQYTSASAGTSEYSWADKGMAATILMHRVALQTKNAQLAQTYQTTIEGYFAQWLPGGAIKRTPRGLAYQYFWGSLRYAANTAHLALVYAKTDGVAPTLRTQLETFATQQINYMLGDCGRSWVVGFGNKSPLLPYHKSSYNAYIHYPMRGQDNGAQGNDFLNSNTPNRFILYGALVGGPADDDRYVDSRQSYEYTEVTQDYNAGFTGAVTGLIEMYAKRGTKFARASDCMLDLGWEYVKQHATNVTEKDREWIKQGDCYHGCGECDEAVLEEVRERNGSTNGNGKGSSKPGKDGKESEESAGRVVSVWSFGVGLAVVAAVGLLM